MPNGPVRQSQLIAPFGVGSIVVMPGGLSLIAAGLDHWYEKENTYARDSPDVDASAFRIEEPRLQALLRVSHFRLPPDYRDYRDATVDQDRQNIGLTVPFLRFPEWHVCRRCGRLHRLAMEDSQRTRCPSCEEEGKRVYLSQVRFIALCEHGHVQDFPWNEWVHHDRAPSCSGTQLRLTRGLGSSLGAFKVHCDECTAEPRSLDRITTATGRSTFLTDNLARGEDPYLCQGAALWLGQRHGQGCSRPLRAALPGAANVYYPEVVSALHLPASAAGVNEVAALMRSDPAVRTFIPLAREVHGAVPVPLVRQVKPDLFEPYDDALIQEALQILESAPDDGEAEEGATDTIEFRRQEFRLLRTSRDDEYLEVDARRGLVEYGPLVEGGLSTVSLVKRVRETRVLTGFTRVFPTNDLTPRQRRSMLRRRPLPPADDWLPGYVVHGEGLFLELDEERLAAWENREDVITRVLPLLERFSQLKQARRSVDKPLGPRFMLLHTLSHLLMNRLVFECGYGSASLRERLFVSEQSGALMAGLLIYTAAGDSEGTLGGLVRMAEPGMLGPVLVRALAEARWCSADPVCMEMGAVGGQGPDNCNLAACHNCALVPETACEEFNRFLDRGLVIGTPSDPGMGYFSGVL